MLAEFLSFKSNGGHVLFNRVRTGDTTLLLYESGTKVNDIITTFLRKGFENDDLCFYAHDPSSRLNIKDDQKNLSIFSFQKNIAFPNLQKFEGELKRIYDSAERKGKPLRVVIDWGDVRNYCKEEDMLKYVEKLVEKKNEITPKPWKKSFRAIQRKFPMLLINAFDINSLSTESINLLVNKHRRILLFTKNETIASLPGVSVMQDIIRPINEALPEDVIEVMIKKNLEPIALSILDKQARSGYSLIKEISSQFHILLSQGTVYPLLYSLEKAGLLQVKNGIGREKIYELTEQGKIVGREKIQNAKKAYAYLLGLLS